MIENDSKDSKENTPSAAEGRSAPIATQSAAGDNERANDCFIKSEYLTVDITNGQELNLEELRQRFPRIAIFKLPHLVLFGNHISLYRLDPKLGVKK